MKNLQKIINTLIWDWNGTLLNDREICISCMNELLAERNLPLLKLEKYLEIFTFPVKDYYIKAGFDFEKEPFEIPAHQFIDHYRKGVLEAPLHPGVADILKHLYGKGYIQAILSAMERDFLLETMSDKNIRQYFKVIYGIDNHLGAGKTMAARQMMNELGCDPASTCIIGDTLHDAEIAKDLNINCILVSNGHQSHQRLMKSGFPVVRKLSDLHRIF